MKIDKETPLQDAVEMVTFRMYMLVPQLKQMPPVAVLGAVDGYIPPHQPRDLTPQCRKRMKQLASTFSVA